MAIDLTVLPDTVDGSLGREKLDPVAAVALDYQVAASEYNAVTAWIKRLAAVVGAENSTDESSVIRVLDALGYGSGRYYRDLQWFLSGPSDAIDAQRWAVDAAGWETLDVEGGAIACPLDLGVEKLCVEHGYPFRRTHLPWMEFRLYLTSVAAGGPEVRIGMGNATRNDGWWITFDPDVDADAILESRNGGRVKTTTIDTVVAGTWRTFRLWLFESGGSYYPAAQMNGGPIVTLTTQAIDAKEFQRQIICSAGGTAGEKVRVSRLVTRADLGA